MADEPITNAEQVTDSTASSEDKSPAQTESEFMDTAIANIKKTQKRILDQDSDTKNTDTNVDIDVSGDTASKKIEELADTEIPEAFSSVAEELGMTPTEIVAIADTHTDEQLLEMTSFLKESMDADVDEDETVDESTEKDDEKSEDTTQELIDQVSEKIRAELGISLEDINTFKEQQVAQQNKQTLETINRRFDEAAKEFPIFGDTEKLPRFTTGRLKGQFIPTSPAYKARMEAVKYADAFMGMGSSVKDAMDLALNTYIGKNLRTEMERSLIKDLKRHERGLSGVRTSKETKRKYADTREAIIEGIRDRQRKAGIEI